MKNFNLIAGISFISVVLMILFVMTSSESNNPNIMSDMNYDEIAVEAQSALDLSSEKSVDVVFKTTAGDIEAKLFTDLVPETTKNFIELAKENKYDGVIFHRVIEDFMVQTGDFENFNGTGGHSYKGPDTTIDEEFHPKLRHVYGALSMAKTAFPSTTGSQFFIVQNQNGTPHLDNAHSVFGMVTSGMDVVESIASTETDYSDKPLEDIVINSIEIK